MIGELTWRRKLKRWPGLLGPLTACAVWSRVKNRSREKKERDLVPKCEIQLEISPPAGFHLEWGIFFFPFAFAVSVLMQELEAVTLVYKW